MVATLLALVPAAGAAKPRAVIIFDRYVTSNPNDNDIFSVRPNGSPENILVDTDYNDWGVAASPDGGLLAFSSDRDSDGNNEIFVKRPGRARAHQLTHSPDAYSEWPSFTPGGKRILFDSDLKSSNNEIQIMRTDGSHLHPLTSGSRGSFDAVMSPDGRKIAFSRFVGTAGNLEIFRMRADGSNEEQVTNDDYQNWFPHPSPNGQFIVFLSSKVVPDTGHPPDGDYFLRLMPATGGEPREIARFYGGNGTFNVPSWSPDSSRIAYVTQEPPR